MTTTTCTTVNITVVQTRIQKHLNLKFVHARKLTERAINRIGNSNEVHEDDIFSEAVRLFDQISIEDQNDMQASYSMINSNSFNCSFVSTSSQNTSTSPVPSGTSNGVEPEWRRKVKQNAQRREAAWLEQNGLLKAQPLASNSLHEKKKFYNSNEPMPQIVTIGKEPEIKVQAGKFAKVDRNTPLRNVSEHSGLPKEQLLTSTSLHKSKYVQKEQPLTSTSLHKIKYCYPSVESTPQISDGESIQNNHSKSTTPSNSVIRSNFTPPKTASPKINFNSQQKKYGDNSWKRNDLSNSAECTSSTTTLSSNDVTELKPSKPTINSNVNTGGSNKSTNVNTYGNNKSTNTVVPVSTVESKASAWKTNTKSPTVTTVDTKPEPEWRRKARLNAEKLEAQWKQKREKDEKCESSKDNSSSSFASCISAPSSPTGIESMATKSDSSANKPKVFQMEENEDFENMTNNNDKLVNPKTVSSSNNPEVCQTKETENLEDTVSTNDEHSSNVDNTLLCSELPVCKTTSDLKADDLPDQVSSDQEQKIQQMNFDEQESELSKKNNSVLASVRKKKKKLQNSIINNKNKIVKGFKKVQRRLSLK